MVRDPVDDAEIEIICPRCGYRMTRSAGRLRRGTPLVCIECGEPIPLDPPESETPS
jgi:predicted RNA-binding Zn-ribbon protein involved in translation (DUF1610 family)